MLSFCASPQGLIGQGLIDQGLVDQGLVEGAGGGVGAAYLSPPRQLQVPADLSHIRNRPEQGVVYIAKI